MEIKKISKYEFEIPKQKGMKVPGRIFTSEKMLKEIEDNAIQQVANVAKLPGIINFSFAMPDIHMGYGFPIGGVAGFDLENGIISPGGVGYDINCGVRVLATNISSKELMPLREKIIHDIKRTIPSGVGRGGEKYSKEEIIQAMTLGSEFALKKGFATKEDLQRTEEYGRVKEADPKFISQRALARGIPQLGTLGAGNHFIDIQIIEEIYNQEIAEVFGLKKDNIVIMIHCGSRGLGHQIASDYIREMEKEYGVEKFPDRELVYAPINSELGKKYFSAMNCAVNFAFCNRQIIMYKIQEILKKYFPNKKTNLVYDVAHNIAKIEEHFVKGKKQKICIHRKGATRCFGPDNPALPKIYQKTGQPVILPGSMATPSFILVGTKTAEEKTFGSTAHGSGRTQSRAQAHRTISIDKVKQILKEQDIILEAGNTKGIIEESPHNYKDSEEIVEICHKLELGKKVAKLKPIAVMIG